MIFFSCPLTPDINWIILDNDAKCKTQDGKRNSLTQNSMSLIILSFPDSTKLLVQWTSEQVQEDSISV